MRFWKRKTETTEPPPAAEEKAGVLNRFKQAVASTRKTIAERFQDITQGKRHIDAEVLENLEEALIGADVGVRTTMEILEKARKEVDRQALSDFDELRNFIKAELLSILRRPSNGGQPAGSPPESNPYVMFVVGVNGVGKTTTIGKLANKFRAEGAGVLLCSADTFRAAASDQLAIWAERADVPIIQQQPGTDPAAVLFDSLKSAQARGADVVIVDTAGRLHTKVNLMQELEKMRRLAAREIPGAPHEVLLIIDAVTGQNGLEQARQFLKAVNVTGLVLTKLDGTAKGGIVVAIAKELGLPIRYVGVGEAIDDLVEFSPEVYVESLFED
jgi:fused signal recognition particle receptor